LTLTDLAIVEHVHEGNWIKKYIDYLRYNYYTAEHSEQGSCNGIITAFSSKPPAGYTTGEGFRLKNWTEALLGNLQRREHGRSVALYSHKSRTSTRIW